MSKSSSVAAGSLSSTPSELTKALAPYDAQIKADDTPFPKDKKLIWICSGRKGSGKSNLILSLLQRPESPVYQSYDNIILISPSAKRDDKFKPLITELTAHNNFYEELTEEVISEILERLQEYNDQYARDAAEYARNKRETGEGFYTREEQVRRRNRVETIIHKLKILPPAPNHLLILDDCLHMMPKSTDKTIINSLWTNHRHSKLSIWVAVQNYNKGANTLVRNNADLISIFRTENKHELDTIKDDLAIEKDLFDRVYDYATSEPYSFMHVNLSSGSGRPVFYKKFDRINGL
jgi:hypothetical protein